MIVEKLTPEEGYNVKWANLQKHKQQGKKMRKAARRSVWWGNRYLRKRIQKEKEKSGSGEEFKTGSVYSKNPGC